MIVIDIFDLSEKSIIYFFKCLKIKNLHNKCFKMEYYINIELIN